MTKDDLYYIRTCQHCGEVNSYGKGHGYYRCSSCKKYTLSIVSRREYYEEMRSSSRTQNSTD